MIIGMSMSLSKEKELREKRLTILEDGLLLNLVNKSRQKHFLNCRLRNLFQELLKQGSVFDLFFLLNWEVRYGKYFL